MADSTNIVSAPPAGSTQTSGGNYNGSDGKTYTRQESGVGTSNYKVNYVVSSPAATSNPLLVTSSNSRSNYNTNVTNMNTALGNLNGGTTNTYDGSGKTVVDNSGKTVAPGVGAGINNNQQSTALTGPYKAGNYTTPDGTNISIDTTGNITNGNGKYKAGDNVSAYADIKDMIPQNNNQSSTGGIDTSSLDPALAASYNSAISTANDILTQRKADLDAAQATVQNDPAAISALNAIKNKYDVLIKAMTDKNNLLIGSYNISNARNGGFQYTPDMTTNFMSAEMDRASTRISDLVNQENDMLLKTTIAYKDGDVKALNAAQTAYDKANTEKLKAISDLATATNNAVKTAQAQEKIDAQATKDSITNDTKTSLGIAGSAADQIATSGLTGKDLDNYIQELATANGISNPNILQTAIDTEQSKRKKGVLANKNVESTIANRGKAGAAKTDPNAAKFNTVETNALYGAGVNSTDIKVIKDNITKYGAQAVIDNPSIPDNIKTILESKYGLTRTTK